jgi:hypothetical protein
MNDPREGGGQQQREADARKSKQELRTLALAAFELAEHLAECWPVRGQGGAFAGPPTAVTASKLTGYLLELGKFIYRFLLPDDPTTRKTWLKTNAAAISAVMKLDVAEAVSQIARVYNHLANQFGWDAAALATGDFCKAVLVPSVRWSRPWQPYDGQPVPEIDPQDIRALEWNAVKLLKASRGEPDGQPLAPVIPDKPKDVGDQASKRTPKVEARDYWLYGRASQTNPPSWKSLMAELNRIADQHGWQKLSTIQGVQQAVDRYTNRHGYPRLPRRKQA